MPVDSALQSAQDRDLTRTHYSMIGRRGWYESGGCSTECIRDAGMPYIGMADIGMDCIGVAYIGMACKVLWPI